MRSGAKAMSCPTSTIGSRPNRKARTNAADPAVPAWGTKSVQSNMWAAPGVRWKTAWRKPGAEKWAGWAQDARARMQSGGSDSKVKNRLVSSASTAVTRSGRTPMANNGLRAEDPAMIQARPLARRSNSPFLSSPGPEPTTKAGAGAMRPARPVTAPRARMRPVLAARWLIKSRPFSARVRSSEAPPDPGRADHPSEIPNRAGKERFISRGDENDRFGVRAVNHQARQSRASNDSQEAQVCKPAGRAGRKFLCSSKARPRSGFGLERDHGRFGPPFGQGGQVVAQAQPEDQNQGKDFAPPFPAPAGGPGPWAGRGRAGRGRQSGGRAGPKDRLPAMISSIRPPSCPCGPGRSRTGPPPRARSRTHASSGSTSAARARNPWASAKAPTSVSIPPMVLSASGSSGSEARAARACSRPVQRPG